MSDADSYRTFILNADKRAMMQQLNLDLKNPLVSAQNLVNMLTMMQNPSPAMQQKLQSGEIDPGHPISTMGETPAPFDPEPTGPDVVVGGGCFHNALLTMRVHAAVERVGRRFHAPSQVPPGDGGLAVGQLAVALATI